VLSFSIKGKKKRTREGPRSLSYASGQLCQRRRDWPIVSPAPSGERRHVTALFADMVGFTAFRTSRRGGNVHPDPAVYEGSWPAQCESSLGPGFRRRWDHGAVRRPRCAGGRPLRVTPAAEVFRAEPGSNRAENFVALARVQIERPVSTGYPGEMSPWPKIPADVITWFRTAFAEANRAATSRLLNVPTQVSSTSRLTLCNAS
jgi:hypothetical protein